MDTANFVRNEEKTLRKRRQSLALSNLRQSVTGTSLAELRTSGIAKVNGKDDDLILKVLSNIDEESIHMNDSRMSRIFKDSGTGMVDEGQKLKEEQARRDSVFWTYFLVIPIIFTHSVATRMQFVYGGLYGREGLGLSNALAIMGVGFTAMGRATAPSLLLRFFKKPHLFMFLNFTTLLGCAGLFLIPIIGGRENFNHIGKLNEDVESTSVGTILFFYLTMYIQGLAEVLSGWDSMMRFEMTTWTLVNQQIAFRASFVSIALGSATGFVCCSWLFDSFGLYGVAWFGVGIGVSNVIFPSTYIFFRWKEFDQWREVGDKKRSEALRRSQPFMQIIKMDNLCEPSDDMRLSTCKLKFTDTSTCNSTVGDRKFSSFSRREMYSRASSTLTTEVKYADARNFFEYKTLLQHQTSRRIVKNFNTILKSATGPSKERMSQISNDDIITAFDPTLLLTHAKHIAWPKDFQKQIYVLKWYFILSLALGSMMISAQFAVYTLYLTDVFNISPLYAGTSMAIGELLGMVTLLISIYLGKKQTKQLIAKEDPSKGSIMANASTGEDVAQESNLLKLLKSPLLLLQIPSMFVLMCFTAAIPLYVLGFARPPKGVEESMWCVGLYLALISAVFVGIVNCLMHATTIEMTAMLLPEDLFDEAIAWGYTMRRITNVLVIFAATFLYELNPHAVYQTIASLYLLSIPISIYILTFYIKCMPWQKRTVVFESFNTADV